MLTSFPPDIKQYLQVKRNLKSEMARLSEPGEKAYILRIAVHPGQRGKGIAKELLEASCRIFLKDNVEEVELHVNSANRIAKNYIKNLVFKL